MAERQPSAATGDAYQAALAYLGRFTDLERRGMTAAPLGLERIRTLVRQLGDPHTRYPSVLIAGTKGKGSTAAMLERALRTAGYRTGLYTQPHLHAIRERIQVNGAPVSPQEFAATLSTVRREVDRAGGCMAETTLYEVTTALALLHFAQAAVDAAVIEVGLGGRLDATNIVPAQVSVLTSISFDHMDVLGSTLTAIATEKADIIKMGQPCVSAPQPPEAMAVIQHVAHARQAPLHIATENAARWEQRGDRWDLHTARGTIADVRPALRGAHQRLNAAVMATVADVLHERSVLRIDLSAVREGIERVVWPGRFEVAGDHPVFVLDGAHNVESAVRLRETLLAECGGLPIVLVLGIAADKDIPGIVAELCGPRLHGPAHGSALPVRAVVATRARHPRAADPSAIAELVRATGVLVETADTVADAMGRARELAGPQAAVVVTGSLYTVAEAREALGLARREEEPPFDPWAVK